MISLVIPISADVPDDLIVQICNTHRRQTADIEIVLARYRGQPFSLSKARNMGARHVKSEWLAFTDFDTCYDDDVLDRMVSLGHDAIAGISRSDVETLADIGSNAPTYQCANSPMLIRRSLFESVGGYCERYAGWGYEDSDFEHKLNYLHHFDSQGYHIKSIHEQVSMNDQWNWGSDDNRKIFDARMSMTLQERIAEDTVIYGSFL